jgi:Zn-finger nucleic acid-binding protein
MAHCMCAACRIRCQTEGSPADLGTDLCPQCGSLLEPVHELASVIGFRRFTLGGVVDAADADRRPHGDRPERFVSRRDELRAREREEAQLLDDRGADLLYAAAVALPRPGMDS